MILVIWKASVISVRDRLLISIVWFLNKQLVNIPYNHLINNTVVVYLKVFLRIPDLISYFLFARFFIYLSINHSIIIFIPYFIPHLYLLNLLILYKNFNFMHFHCIVKKIPCFYLDLQWKVYLVFYRNKGNYKSS